MVQQLLKINENFIENIIIMNNVSTCEKTIEYLKNTKCKVIQSLANTYPQIYEYHHVYHEIYCSMPDYYILTDADLELNENLPKNFIEILIELSETHHLSKIGFALDISEPDKMYNENYSCPNFSSNSISDWESKFWQNKIENKDYEMYRGWIDTTFCLYNKKYFHAGVNFLEAIRIAGDFTCKHLPWYKDNKVLSICENYLMYKNSNTNISSIANLVINHIENSYRQIVKNKEPFLIDNNDYNTIINYLTIDDENKYIEIEKYLHKDKIVINLDKEIGLNGMYFTRKAKQVYSIETNFEFLDIIKKNYKNNCCKNYTFLNEISLITNNNNIDTKEISLINVNLNGDEEYLLNDLYIMHQTHKIPLYITFNLNNWNDKNLEKFDFLTEEQKNEIKKEVNISLLFEIEDLSGNNINIVEDLSGININIVEDLSGNNINIVEDLSPQL
jgi:hypothetical protein